MQCHNMMAFTYSLLHKERLFSRQRQAWRPTYRRTKHHNYNTEPYHEYFSSKKETKAEKLWFV